MPISPTIIVFALVIWIASCGGSFLYGHHVESLACTAAGAGADKAVAEQKDKDAQKQNAPSVALE